MATKIKKRLLMTFKNQDGKNVSLTVDNPSEYVDEIMIKDAMNTIVAKNIFAPNELDLVSSVEAKIIITNTNEYELV